METSLSLPFIRWADTVRVAAGGQGAFERQIYDHELVYILKGQGSIVIEGHKYRAFPDALFLVRPRQWHSFLADGGQEQRLLGVHFDGDWSDAARLESFLPARDPVDESLFRAPLPITGFSAQPFIDLRGRPRVRRLLEEVVAEYGRGDSEARRLAGALLAGTLLQIEREARLFSEVQSHAKVGPDAVRRVQKAREWLEAGRDEPVSIADVAAHVGWSPDHLRRMFREVLGSAPAQIQTAARVRRAKELLRYRELPVAEIARKCGFDDASHFARVFKREVGCTPREWAGLSGGEQE